MGDLTELQIASLSAEEARAELLSLRDRYMAMHRRAQGSHESRKTRAMQRRVDLAEAQMVMWRESWVHEFSRVCRLLSFAQRIYVLGAEKLDLPRQWFNGTYDRTDGSVVAVPYLTRQGGWEHHNVEDVIMQALSSPGKEA